MQSYCLKDIIAIKLPIMSKILSKYITTKLFNLEVCINILNKMDCETLKKLYINSVYFYEILNNPKILGLLRVFKRIIPEITSFPEYHIQYMIKWHPYDAPFNITFCTEEALSNDDPEAIENILDGNKSDKLLRKILNLSVRDKRSNIINHLLSSEELKYFYNGYNGVDYNFNSWEDLEDLIAGILYKPEVEDNDKIGTINTLLLDKNIIDCPVKSIRNIIQLVYIYLAENVPDIKECILIINRIKNIHNNIGELIHLNIFVNTLSVYVEEKM